MAIRYFSVESSNLDGVAYDPASRELVVKFSSGQEPYHYADVPPEHVAEVLFAESQGSTFAKLIRNGGFRFHKLRLDEVADMGIRIPGVDIPAPRAKMEKEPSEPPPEEPATAEPDTRTSLEKAVEADQIQEAETGGGEEERQVRPLAGSFEEEEEA